MTFSVHEDRENEMKEILTTVYDALRQKGYNPINQLVGYILSEDPTYITTFNNARGLIRHIDRDELLQVLVKSYLSDWAFHRDSVIKQMKSKTFKKEYFAICDGSFSSDLYSGTINAPIARKENSIIERCIDFKKRKYSNYTL